MTGVTMDVVCAILSLDSAYKRTLAADQKEPRQEQASSLLGSKV